MYLNQAVNKYLRWKATVTNKAYISYEPYLRYFERLTKKRLENTTTDDVARYKRFLDLYRDRFGRPYSDKTKGYALTILRNFYIYWNTYGRGLPATQIRPPKCASRPRKWVTEEEYLELLKATNPGQFWGLQKHLIVRILWESGVRVSELTEMNISQLDRHKTGILIQAKKSYQLGWMFWSGETHDLLMKWLGVRLTMNEQDNLWVVRTSRYGVIRRVKPTTKTIQIWIRDLARKAGLRHISPHQFRHGRAHYIRERGGDLLDIKTVLRHTAPESSLLYLREDMREAQRVAERYL